MTTNNQHTPGPWRTATDSFGTFVETTGASIAKIGSPDDEINQANARLIAAAPCMYEALQRIFDGVPAYHEGEFITLHFDENGNEIGVERHDPAAIIQSILGVAQAAITKATIPSA